MNNVVRFAVRNDTAEQNWQRGYDAGYIDGTSQRMVDQLVAGFWFGIGTAAVIVVLVWVATLMGVA